MSDKTILLAMLNEAGHLNPTFKLSKALRARGHDVRYLAIADVAEAIEAQGFVVEPLAPALFPRGVTDADRALSTLARRRAITRRYEALLDHLVASPAEALLSRRPDLLLVDVTQTQVALWARRERLPMHYVNTSLPQTEEPGVPPLRSFAPYGADVAGRARTKLAWQRFLVKRRLSAELVRPLGMCPPYELARRAASRFGVPEAALETHTVYMPQLRGVPELVLGPEAFDFPRPPRVDRHYVASVDLARGEPPLPPVPGEGPLFYAALGSQIYRAGEVPAFFRRLVAVFRAQPTWRLLLAVGRHVAPHALAAPPNVTVVERAPQLAALAAARVMITHGGLGSIKECILHGVPMLGVPLDVDQPGNVARLVHHGLGLHADVRLATVDTLATSLARLLDDPAFAGRARAMQALFRASEADERGVALIEQAL